MLDAPPAAHSEITPEEEAIFQAIVDGGMAFRNRICEMVLADPENSPPTSHAVFGLCMQLALMRPENDIPLDEWIDRIGRTVRFCTLRVQTFVTEAPAGCPDAPAPAADPSSLLH